MRLRCGKNPEAILYERHSSEREQQQSQRPDLEGLTQGGTDALMKTMAATKREGTTQQA